MTDDELLDKMHAAYHLAWEKADRRRNVTRQVMLPLLALVREHDDRDRGQGERDMAQRYTTACETNVALQAKLTAALATCSTCGGVLAWDGVQRPCINGCKAVEGAVKR